MYHVRDLNMLNAVFWAYYIPFRWLLAHLEVKSKQETTFGFLGDFQKQNIC